jgi:hypothetical protein
VLPGHAHHVPQHHVQVGVLAAAAQDYLVLAHRVVQVVVAHQAGETRPGEARVVSGDRHGGAGGDGVRLNDDRTVVDLRDAAKGEARQRGWFQATVWQM